MATINRDNPNQHEEQGEEVQDFLEDVEKIASKRIYQPAIGESERCAPNIPGWGEQNASISTCINEYLLAS